MTSISFWSDPEPIGEDHPEGWRIRYVVGLAVMGSVTCFGNDVYYPVTQVRRFGAFADLQRAATCVELNAVLDVVDFETVGTA